MKLLATFKHISSKNADYGAAEAYLTFEHDEFTMKPTLDENGRLVPREGYRLATLNCGEEDFAVACLRSNLRYGKNQKREDVKSHHYIISFDPRDGTDNGLTVDKAQSLGEEFCNEHFPGHQAIVCTHPDGHNHSGNIHVHIVINSLRIEAVPLLPYMDRPADTKCGIKHRCTDAAMEYFKSEVMEMCHRENLYQIDLLHGSKNRVTEREYWAQKKGQLALDKENAAREATGQPTKPTKFETDKAKLRRTIRQALSQAGSFDEFSSLLLREGVTVKESRGRLSYLTPDRTKPITARKLGDDFDKALSGVEAVFVDENRINSLTDGKASVALKDYAGTEKQVSIYAKDYAGNRSDAVKLDNPYYKEPAPEKKPAVAAPQSPSGTQTKPPKEEKPSGSNVATPSGGGNSSGSDNSTGQQENTSAVPEGAFTPEGTGTVQDNISGTDGEKQFYTITTDAGNVFYLVIDGKREDNNVYFLNGVTESDLMALAEKNNGSMSMIPQEESCSCTEKCEAGKVNTGCPVCKNDLNGCKGKEKPTETEKPAEPEKPKKETGSVGTILFILVALLAVGGIGYYVKIVRPKQQAEDDAEFEDDGYGEGFDPDEAYGEPEYLSEDDFDDKDSK